MTTLTMKEAKILGTKAAGQEFICDRGDKAGNVPTGSVGIILPELSEHGKVQAELTCAEEGCTNRHVREASDWHQCNKCHEHSKSKGKSKKAGNHVSLGGGRTVKVMLPDGTEETIQEMKILETDDEEMKAIKTANNEIFQREWARELARREAVKEADKLERAAKAEEAKAKRQAELDAKKKEEARARLARVQAFAEKVGAPISDKTLADAS